MKTFLLLLVLFQSQISFGSELNLKDLGYNKSDLQANPELEKTLQERRYDLEQHKAWGIVAIGAMAAAFLTPEEHDVPPIHPFLGGLAVGTYAVSAYYALAAPDRPTSDSKGGSKWHRYLAWIHLPGMVLTPVLGYMAAQRIHDGKPVEGIAKQHGAVATTTVVAFALSVLSVSIEF